MQNFYVPRISKEQNCALNKTGGLARDESSTLCLVGHYQPKSIAIPSTVHVHIHSFSVEMWGVLRTFHGNREEDEKAPPLKNTELQKHLKGHKSHLQEYCINRYKQHRLLGYP